ncbi:hypothetical protein F5148DRAFT_1148229 [Russula earlei]|uniref:Uncharacterized protein n=1 Tax=Russula earlei TaxID=71964 RepID=A0ACC0UCR7_9AGAM|nr:hypothetical protein F5148DRAFT_1148229 [Russula earlei]
MYSNLGYKIEVRYVVRPQDLPGSDEKYEWVLPKGWNKNYGGDGDLLEIPLDVYNSRCVFARLGSRHFSRFFTDALCQWEVFGGQVCALEMERRFGCGRAGLSGVCATHARSSHWKRRAPEDPEGGVPHSRSVPGHTRSTISLPRVQSRCCATLCCMSVRGMQKVAALNAEFRALPWDIVVVVVVVVVPSSRMDDSWDEYNLSEFSAADIVHIDTTTRELNHHRHGTRTVVDVSSSGAAERRVGTSGPGGPLIAVVLEPAADESVLVKVAEDGGVGGDSTVVVAEAQNMVDVRGAIRLKQPPPPINFGRAWSVREAQTAWNPERL